MQWLCHTNEAFPLRTQSTTPSTSAQLRQGRPSAVPCMAIAAQQDAGWMLGAIRGSTATQRHFIGKDLSISTAFPQTGHRVSDGNLC